MAFKDIMNRAGEQPVETTTAATTAPPQTRPVQAATPATCIDASTELKGTLRCRESIRIDGRVEGEVHCDKNVIIGEGASVRATIAADEAAISGEVKGDITAGRKITLKRTACVIGDLCTPGIVIEEGAKLEGRIMIGSDDQPEARVTPEAKAAPAPRVEGRPASVPSGSKSPPKAPTPPVAP